MGCEICGRSACTRSFHSLESQEEFDEKMKEANVDRIKENIKNSILRQINRLSGEYINEREYISTDDVVKIIEYNF